MPFGTGVHVRRPPSGSPPARPYRPGRPLTRRILATLVLALALPALLGAGPAPEGSVDPGDLVDPFVGTFPPGFVNPGPVLPHGMVGLGPDTTGPFHYGGYNWTDRAITGFSHIHMSAGVPQGGQIPLMPVTGEVHLGDAQTTGPVPAYASPFTHTDEDAEPGRYRVGLHRYGVDVELSATTRAGFHRYTFPAGAQAHVVLDVSRDLKGRHPAAATVHDDGTVTGWIRTSSPDHTVFFAARFDRPIETATGFSGTTTSPARSVSGDDVGLILGFGDAGGTVQAKVGISYVDEDGALTNLETEIPGWSFETVRRDARTAWRDALSRIDVDGGAAAERTSFYTALYHTQLFPNVFSDVDGRYRGPDDVVRTDDRPHYTGFSLWDSYRGQNQLLATIDPDSYRDMVASLLDFHRQGGELPRWQLANRNPGYMSGDPVIPFIGEAWCRGLVPPQDRRELFDAMRQLTERRPSYVELGYQPTPRPRDPGDQLTGGARDAGTTLEYGVAEFALALMADDRNLHDDRDTLLDRSLGYRHLLDPEARWIRPRHADGSWLTPFAPENGYGFQEGTSWQYSWLAMHDLAGLFDRMGGDDAAQDRLDTFFNLPATATAPVVWPKIQNQATVFGIEYRGNQYAPGNEHDLHAPYLYAHAGAPWKTQAVARGVTSLFTPTPDGLPGNDDLGALSGWLVWSMLGLYPITPGAPLYVVGSPVFEHATVHLPGGDLTIGAPGASFVTKYVRRASLQGEPLDRPWVHHDEFENGAVLRFEMDAVPATDHWADPSAAPPSLSTHDTSAFGCDSTPADSHR